jgi:hypothetical protein
MFFTCFVFDAATMLPPRFIPCCRQSGAFRLGWTSTYLLVVSLLVVSLLVVSLLVVSLLVVSLLRQQWWGMSLGVSFVLCHSNLFFFFFPAPVPRGKWRFWKKAPFVTASDHRGNTTKHATHWACPSMSPCPRLNVSHCLFVCLCCPIDD